jgi:hypothetical protein
MAKEPHIVFSRGAILRFFSQERLHFKQKEKSWATSTNENSSKIGPSEEVLHQQITEHLWHNAGPGSYR